MPETHWPVSNNGRNFLRLNDGTIDFGKLTMHHVDLIMVDLSNDAWFDLDLNNYQNQLVNGYTRMTPQAGLQIFMPDLDTLPKNIRRPGHQHGVDKKPKPCSPLGRNFQVVLAKGQDRREFKRGC